MYLMGRDHRTNRHKSLAPSKNNVQILVCNHTAMKGCNIRKAKVKARIVTGNGIKIEIKAWLNE